MMGTVYLLRLGNEAPVISNSIYAVRKSKILTIMAAYSL